MQAILRFFARRISSDKFDLRLAELVCFAGSLITLVCGLGALSRLNMAGGEYFLGLLGVVNLAVLLVILGNCLSQSARSSSNQKE